MGGGRHRGTNAKTLEVRVQKSEVRRLFCLTSELRRTMKIGLVGFSGSGKSTVFQWLTGVVPDAARVQQGQIGTAKLPDPRVGKLSAMFKPKKTTYAEIA